MAYSLKRNESVIAGLKRVVRNEMESAEEHLTGKKKATPDEAIHEARKSIKKVRAILRAVRREPGGAYRQENTRLRDVARKLSPFRDAFAIIQTFDELRTRYQSEAGADKLSSVRGGLMKKRNEPGREEEIGAVLGEAAAALRKTSNRVKRWALTSDGYAALAPGLEDTYRAGQKALTRARKNPRPENYHDLRKRVKDHWYHVRLLEGLWTEVMGAYEKSLKDLETWLGTDHNLLVLREKLVAEPAFYGKDKDIDLALELIDKYQKELRDNSISLAARIYEEKPSEFTRRMTHLWDAWQQEPRSLEKLQKRAGEAAESSRRKQSARKPAGSVRSKARANQGPSLTAA
jgi:CHAD domain-containing protein